MMPERIERRRELTERVADAAPRHSVEAVLVSADPPRCCDGNRPRARSREWAEDPCVVQDQAVVVERVVLPEETPVAAPAGTA